MSREIKFRVWDNVDYMSTPFTLQDLQTKRIEFAYDLPVMQWTGLLDKNGKEIYEGDILKTWYSRDMSGNDIVEHVFAVEWVEEISAGKIRTGFDDIPFFETAEIIGNCYESPELLKQ